MRATHIKSKCTSRIKALDGLMLVVHHGCMSHLSEYLKQNGISQRSFAATVGVDQSVISRLCADKGDAKPSLALAVRIELETKGKVPATVWVFPQDESAMRAVHKAVHGSRARQVSAAQKRETGKRVGA